MFELSVTSHFSSAHRLKGHEGACHNLHGHNWDVEVFLRGECANAIGMLVDFGEIKASLHDVVCALDHKDLNSLPAFSGHNPTSENLAKYIFKALYDRLHSDPVSVHRVRVSESPGTSACYWEEDKKLLGHKKAQGA